MKTKSSLPRILWSLVYVTLALVGLRMATGVESSQVAAPPQRGRTVVKKPWRVEPVKVVGVRTRKKQSIEMGKQFLDDDNWFDGLAVTVLNDSDKVVTAVTVEIVFRREAGDKRPAVARDLHFGPSPSGPEYIYRDPSKVIKPGQTADLQLGTASYKTLVSDLENTGYLGGVDRVELVIREVGFEDGSMIHSGMLYLQDPANPHDPTKKIPGSIRRPRANHTRSDLPLPRIRDSSLIPQFIKASLALTNGAQSEQCYGQDIPRAPLVRFNASMFDIHRSCGRFC